VEQTKEFYFTSYLVYYLLAYKDRPSAYGIKRLLNAQIPVYDKYPKFRRHELNKNYKMICDGFIYKVICYMNGGAYYAHQPDRMQ